MVKVAEEHCPTALPQAKLIEERYLKLFTLFGECHKIYDGRAVTDDQIDDLGKSYLKSTINGGCIMLFNVTLEKKIVAFMNLHSGDFSMGHCVTKDAHARGTRCALVEKVAHWLWLDG